jgi:hypothetical protein
MATKRLTDLSLSVDFMCLQARARQQQAADAAQAAQAAAKRNEPLADELLLRTERQALAEKGPAEGEGDEYEEYEDEEEEYEDEEEEAAGAAGAVA